MTKKELTNLIEDAKKTGEYIEIHEEEWYFYIEADFHNDVIVRAANENNQIEIGCADEKYIVNTIIDFIKRF